MSPYLGTCCSLCPFLAHGKHLRCLPVYREALHPLGASPLPRPGGFSGPWLLDNVYTCPSLAARVTLRGMSPSDSDP